MEATLFGAVTGEKMDGQLNDLADQPTYKHNRGGIQRSTRKAGNFEKKRAQVYGRFGGNRT
jgi:hypothetical protein